MHHCPAHPSAVLKLKDVKTKDSYFSTKETTAPIQSNDQGIIQAYKPYHSELLAHVVNSD
jgi:hypothetical protein